MPIRFPEPPQPVVERLDLPPAAAAAGDVPLPAQPIFTVGLDELIEAGGGAAAEESVSAPPTWRYSRFDPSGQAEVLELPTQAEGGTLAAGNDRFSPMIREALAIASEDPRVRDHEYEARLYRVPALSLLALWLHADEVFDLFVPIARQVGELEPNRVYDDEEFMSRVRSAAERMSALYDEAEDADELGS
jgi:hypothetical protein